MNDAPMSKPAPQSGFVPPIDLGALGAAPSQQAPVNAYLHSRVMSARPEELRMMLLDAAVVAAMQARDGLAAKDFERSFNGVSRCRDIIVELMSGVRDEPDAELAKNVRALYAYIFQELTEARSTKDAARMEKVVGLSTSGRRGACCSGGSASAVRARRSGRQMPRSRSTHSSVGRCHLRRE